MQIVSWNIRYGTEVERAVSELLATNAERPIDLLLLQEMDEAGTARIAEELGAGYVYSSASPHRHTGRDFGNAVLSRWPIEDPAEIPLPHVARMSGQPRSATHAIVHVEDHDVSVYSVHTEIPALGLSRRREQFEAVADDIRRRNHRRVVVAGDFNTVTARSVRALTSVMAGAGLRRVSPLSASYRRFGHQMTLDHVFAAGFDAAASGIVPETDASDHVAVWVDLVAR